MKNTSLAVAQAVIALLLLAHPVYAVEIQNPLGVKTVAELVARAINIMFYLSGSVALLIFVYGGFMMLASRGEQKMWQQGIDAIKWAVIGLAVMLVSAAFLQQVLRWLTVGVS